MDVLVEARGNAFGLLVGERGYVDNADPEVRRGLDLAVIVLVDAQGRAAAPVVKATRCCGG